MCMHPYTYSFDVYELAGHGDCQIRKNHEGRQLEDPISEQIPRQSFHPQEKFINCRLSNIELGSPKLEQ